MIAQACWAVPGPTCRQQWRVVVGHQSLINVFFVSSSGRAAEWIWIYRSWGRAVCHTEHVCLSNAPHGPEGAHYPGTCRNLSDREIQQNLEAGKEPAWRLNSLKAADLFPDLTFTDAFHGTIEVDPTLLGDTILARKDIGTSYHIAVVVDDAHQEITDVTRGEDLLHATHIHRVLQAALGLPEPRHHHHKLICDDHGNRLAKRHDSQSIKALRDEGFSREEIWGMIEI